MQTESILLLLQQDVILQRHVPWDDDGLYDDAAPDADPDGQDGAHGGFGRHRGVHYCAADET